MVKQIVIYWRDIPSQVIVQRGRRREKVLLSQRFQEAIDRAAMRAGKGSSDAYIAEWRRDASTVETDDDLDSLAQKHRSGLEAEFSDERLLELIRNHGIGRRATNHVSYATLVGAPRTLAQSSLCRLRVLCCVHCNPLFRLVGYERLDKPFVAVEKVTKGFLLDSQSCGQCIVGFTGLSCPMNCPKKMRNGPCGGVRADGKCEVDPDMTCVWVLAWEGNKRFRAAGLPDPGLAAARRSSPDGYVGLAARSAHENGAYRARSHVCQ